MREGRRGVAGVAAPARWSEMYLQGVQDPQDPRASPLWAGFATARLSDSGSRAGDTEILLDDTRRMALSVCGRRGVPDGHRARSSMTCRMSGRSFRGFCPRRRATLRADCRMDHSSFMPSDAKRKLIGFGDMGAADVSFEPRPDRRWCGRRAGPGGNRGRTGQSVLLHFADQVPAFGIGRGDVFQ